MRRTRMDEEQDIIVREMNARDAEKLDIIMEKPAGIQSIYKSYLKETTSGQCQYMVIYDMGQIAGYAKIDWKSNYEDFDEAGIPEIKQIQVFKDFRHKGLGNRLMDQIEKIVKERSDYCGVGVGLAQPYEAAAKLLAKRGYEPDGRGVFYIEPEYVQDELEVDDYQALMLIKKL
ncbi:MAG: GNAT family N-acetyltransferase [Cellulosilyticum sp.]|nr:GNAT family N-acetyltransferase [Cellulosilyticum sp.]